PFSLRGVIRPPLLRVGRALLSHGQRAGFRHAAVRVFFALEGDFHGVNMLALTAASFVIWATAMRLAVIVIRHDHYVLACAGVTWHVPHAALMGQLFCCC